MNSDLLGGVISISRRLLVFIGTHAFIIIYLCIAPYIMHYILWYERKNVFLIYGYRIYTGGMKKVFFNEVQR